MDTVRFRVKLPNDLHVEHQSSPLIYRALDDFASGGVRVIGT